MDWNYSREERKGFTVLPVGRYRIRIKDAEVTKAKSSGRDMLKLTFEVSGKNSLLFHNIVFNNSDKDSIALTNRLLTQFFDSFKDIPEGDFNTKNWIGKVGACQVKHEEYNGDDVARVHYFIAANKQAELPPWIEPDRASSNSGSTIASAPTDENGFMAMPDDMPLF